MINNVIDGLLSTVRIYDAFDDSVYPYQRFASMMLLMIWFIPLSMVRIYDAFGDLVYPSINGSHL